MAESMLKEASSARRRVMGQPGDEPLQFLASLYERGFKHALDEGVKKRVQETEAELAAAAESSARCLLASSYNPENNPADRLAEAAQERERERLESVDEQLEHAEAARRDRVRERAGLGEPTPKPELPVLVGLLGGLGVALTISFSLHDALFARLIPQRETAFVLAFVSGALLAGLVCWGILKGAEHESGKYTHWAWLGVALLFGAALLVLRIGGQTNERARATGIGLALVEVVCLIVVELNGAGLRRAWDRVRAERHSFAVADAHVTAADTLVRTIKESRAECLAEMEAHRAHVAERESLVRSNPLIVEHARRATLLGYGHGVALNRTRLTKGEPIMPSRAEVIERLGGVAASEPGDSTASRITAR